MEEKDYQFEVGENLKETSMFWASVKYVIPMLIVAYIVYKIFSYIDFFMANNYYGF